jgi:broad specificity phosphatase PhoE
MAHFEEPAPTHYEGIPIAHLDAVEAEHFRQAYRQLRPHMGLPRPLRLIATARPDHWQAPVLKPNAKLIHFIRHGEGMHNRAASESQYKCYCETQAKGCQPCPYINEDLVDPVLTDKGREQAAALQAVTRFHAPTLVVVSPLTRAIQTACIAYDHLLQRSPALQAALPWIAVEAVRERFGNHSCDMRRDVAEVAAEFPHIDFSSVPPTDEAWTKTRETTAHLVERAIGALQFLGERTESEIVVATSSAFLLTVFLALLETDDFNMRSWFRTGELRSVVIEFQPR